MLKPAALLYLVHLVSCALQKPQTDSRGQQQAQATCIRSRVVVPSGWKEVDG